MIFGVPISEFVWLAAAIIVGGIISGFLAGLFGIGGGAIVVPVLFEVFRFLGVPEAVHMQLAIGTSLAIMAPTNIRSYAAHRASGAVLEDIVWQWSLPAVIGTGVGSLIATVAPSAVFKLAFVIVIGIIAVKLLFGKDTWRIADDLPRSPWVRGFGFLVGLSAALTGVSGGSLCTMVLTLYGKTIHTAVATSAGLIVPITIAGTIGYALAGLPHQAPLPPPSVGFVLLIGLALVAPGASPAAAPAARAASGVCQ